MQLPYTSLFALTAVMISSAALAQDDALTPPPPGIAGGHGRASLIASYDQNGDGEVPRAEFDAVRAERFAWADKDGDGVLTQAEYVAEFEHRLKMQYADQGREPDAFYERSIAQAYDRFDILDADKDGLLTRDEDLAMADRTFTRQDTNGDGVVSTADPEPERPAPAAAPAPQD